jgi:hypothetical protein
LLIYIPVLYIQYAPDVSAHTWGQMINDGELRSACHRLCGACRVVNSALDRILDPSSGHKPQFLRRLEWSQSTEQKEQWTEHNFKHHYLSMYLFVSGRKVSMLNVYCNKNLPAAKQGARRRRRPLVQINGTRVRMGLPA